MFRFYLTRKHPVKVITGAIFYSQIHFVQRICTLGGRSVGGLAC